ncbi:DUF418 domain-containing protein [Novosphingobium resinovorum]
MSGEQGLTFSDLAEEDAPAAAPARLETLDLIRGVAVLGILAINIAGFAGPMIGTTTPTLLHPVSPLDEAAWAFSFLFFEGKMRALFTLLFGAGLVLFHERAEAAGRDGDQIQLRRLGWLLLLGIAHYLLLWWGDILFLYAACGIAALLMRPLSDRMLLWIALALYYAWHIWGCSTPRPPSTPNTPCATTSPRRSNCACSRPDCSRCTTGQRRKCTRPGLAGSTSCGSSWSNAPSGRFR